MLAVPLVALALSGTPALAVTDASTTETNVDTAVVVQGPPIGTDTTGQGQEGAACV